MALNDPRLTGAIGNRLRFITGDHFGRAIARGVRGMNNGIVAAAEAWAKEMGDAGDMKRIHDTVAEEMRLEVLAAYDRTVEARKRVPSYRVGQNRMSGGALRSALESRTHYVATPQGITYIDQNLLNQEAAHWQRLNFGAGEAGRLNPPGSFRFVFDGRVITHLEFRAQPREAFHMPYGLFREAGGGAQVDFDGGRRGSDEFYVRLRKGRPKFWINPTRGIEARQFLDAGLEVMAEELPGRYQQQMELWAAAGTEAGQRYLAQIRKISTAPGLPIRRR